jgi:tetratricopeptide (TPR) repeat protein
VVTDFGLAKLVDGTSVDTVEGALMGTPMYMSPEQVRGRKVDARTDVYSLGAILYEMLSGSPPFAQCQGAQIFEKILKEEPSLPTSAPRDLVAVCRKAIEKDLHDRYGTAEELANDLRRSLDGAPVHARSIPLFQRAGRWALRNPWPLAALGCILLLAAIASTLLLREIRKSKAESELGGHWEERLWEGSLREAEREIAVSRLQAPTARATLVEGRLLLFRESWEKAAEAFRRTPGVAARTAEARAWLELCCSVENEFTYFEVPGISENSEQPNPTAVSASDEKRRVWAQQAYDALQSALGFGLSPPDVASVRAIQSFLDNDIERLKAIASESGEDEYVVRLVAEAHRRARRPAEAIAEYRKVAARRPNAARHHVRLAVLHLEAKEFMEAIVQATRALELVPTRMDALFFRGIALNRLWMQGGERAPSMANQAEADFSAVLASNPSGDLRRVVLFARGNALYHLWKSTNNLEFLQEAIRHRREAMEAASETHWNRENLLRVLRLWEDELARERK